MSYRRIDSLFSSKIQILLVSVLFILISAASASAREVTLSWDANSEPDIDHYVVYWGVTPGDYTNSSDVGLGTEFSTEIPDGVTYFFAVTAVDEAGLESDYSNEVSTDPSLIYINSNWNLLSISYGSVTTSIEDALEPIMDDVISVWSYDDGSWLVYDPENPGFSDLLEVEPGKGLWVNMRSNAQLSLPGVSPAGGVDLSDGWNLVGFSSQASQDITDAISSIDEDVDLVYAYQNGEWLVYDPQDPASSTLTTMNSGYGYWIKMNAPSVWTY